MRNRIWLLLVYAAVLVTAPVAADAKENSSPAASSTQRGLASYYGPGFEGDRTASGEIFGEDKLVAAHRTLPLGSIVRVTNLKNGRSVVLRVIDRGPYGRNHRKGCIIDVSRGAARRLRFVKEGLARVVVQVLK